MGVSSISWMPNPLHLMGVLDTTGMPKPLHLMGVLDTSWVLNDTIRWSLVFSVGAAAG
jgi:hypothetical protein